MFGQIKLAITIMLVVGIAGAGVYVMKLRSDNAILQANQVQLEESINEQKSLLENQKKDFEQIKTGLSFKKIIKSVQNNLPKGTREVSVEYTNRKGTPVSRMVRVPIGRKKKIGK